MSFTSNSSGPERSVDQWLDEALAESFPASDPLPQFHGASEAVVAQGEPHAEPEVSPDAIAWRGAKET